MKLVVRGVGGWSGQLNLCLEGEWGAESETKLKPLTFWVESGATYVWVASSTVCAVQGGSCLISSTAVEGLPPSASSPSLPLPVLSPVRQSHCPAYVGKTQRWRWNICVFNFTCVGVCLCELLKDCWGALCILFSLCLSLLTLSLLSLLPHIFIFHLISNFSFNVFNGTWCN